MSSAGVCAWPISFSFAFHRLSCAGDPYPLCRRKRPCIKRGDSCEPESAFGYRRCDAGTGQRMAELAWLGIVRHGESTGNVAALQAETARSEVIDLPQRDADVPLSETGRE